MSQRSAKHHEFSADADAQMPSERSTGIVFAVVFAIAAVLLRHDMAYCGTAAAASAAFLMTALLAPSWLAGLNRAWFRFALFLNSVVSPVVLLVLYTIAIVPFGLALQMRADPLRARRPVDARTYWIARTRAHDNNMRDQF